jgi:hypothetical protein
MQAGDLADISSIRRSQTFHLGATLQ